MPWIGFERLAGALAALARPATDVYNGASKSKADKAAAHTDGQTKYKPAKQADKPPEVARATAASQIMSLEAEPPLAWVASRSAWRCEADTHIALTLSDGTAARHVYDQGTLIPVAAGLVHFPAGREGSG